MNCMGSVPVRNNRYDPSEEIITQLKVIHDAHEEQAEQFKKVKSTIRGVIYGVTTIENAKLILDESLHKYLPVKVDAKSPANQLVTTELMDNLKNLGFGLKGIA